MNTGWGSGISWHPLLDFVASLLGELIVVELRRVSGCHHLLLSLWSCCCASGRLRSFSGVASPLDVLQKERLVSLKIGVSIDLKGNESL